MFKSTLCSSPRFVRVHAVLTRPPVVQTARSHFLKKHTCSPSTPVLRPRLCSVHSCSPFTFFYGRKLQTTEKSRGLLRFGRKFDRNDRSDENYHFKKFAWADFSEKLRENFAKASSQGSVDASPPPRRRRKIKNIADCSGVELHLHAECTHQFPLG